MKSATEEFEQFDWDENKNEINQRKHGIDFLQAAKALQKPLGSSLKPRRRSENAGDLP
ncbi:BrnT family toxin [Rhizobium sp. TRM95796]|uniref:BrnT family toxin n=1 Tax=Rhizobium sp. TRM95796 TaxID=2979862 RepID=UPI0021E849CA|nr:BrnT family toxin [Rhizobium sp. TRM95796]MCV3764767.1 BrnT family toxin [Rhizobium sp. TRM95796]